MFLFENIIIRFSRYTFTIIVYHLELKLKDIAYTGIFNKGIDKIEKAVINPNPVFYFLVDFNFFSQVRLHI